MALRKDLAGQGLDAGPHTIAWHLARRGDPVPMLWRLPGVSAGRDVCECFAVAPG